jgi:hypothetical protein
MLIDYSERACALLARPLSSDEQHELYDVFYRVGTGLGILTCLPSYTEWRTGSRAAPSPGPVAQRRHRRVVCEYRKHLGAWRYRLLLRIQAVLAPGHVRDCWG